MKYTFQPTPPPSLQSDLARLLSILRERQSALVIMLEEKQGRQWQRPAWMLKECQYQEKDSRLSRQIRSLVLRWALIGDETAVMQGARYLRSFWVKVKLIIKMSLERIKILSLLNYQLFEQYEAIIDAINQGYDHTAGIPYFRDIQEMIRNRNSNIHQLISRGTFPVNSKYRLDISVQHKEYPSEPKLLEPVSSAKPKEIITQDPQQRKRPLSQQSRKNHLHPKNLFFSKKIKRIEKIISAYQENTEDLMAARLEVTLYKKKSLQQNIEYLVEDLMQRNINNHKDISKFIFSYGRHPNRYHSKRVLKPTFRKILVAQTPKPKQAKKKPKLMLVSERAVSAKLKRKQPKLIHKMRQSQILELEGCCKLKKLFIR